MPIGENSTEEKIEDPEPEEPKKKTEEEDDDDDEEEIAPKPKRKQKQKAEASGEREKSAINNAVSEIENKDAKDPVISSKWMSGAKKFGVASAVGLGVPLLIGFKILQGAYKFAKEAIQKKGNVGFSKGYEIGKGMFPKEDKKGKK